MMGRWILPGGVKFWGIFSLESMTPGWGVRLVDWSVGLLVGWSVSRLGNTFFYFGPNLSALQSVFSEFGRIV